MAMTGAVKDELARLPITKPCCRKAEVSAILRFAGGLHLVSGVGDGVPFQHELARRAIARRFKAATQLRGRRVACERRGCQAANHYYDDASQMT